MSKSNDLVFSLNQQQKALQDLNANSSRDLEVLDEQIRLAIERSDRISANIEELRGIDSQKDKIVAELESEVTMLQNELARKIEDLAQLQGNLNQIKIKNQELGGKVAAKDELAGNTVTSREMAEKDLEDQRTRVQQLETELTQIEATHEDNIKELREQVLMESTKFNSASSSHKALALLIREKAIDLPEISIIEALINKNESSIEFIQRSTGLRIDLVVQVVKGLASRGLLDFIEDSGAIKVKEMITL